MSVQRNDIVLVGQKFHYKTYSNWPSEVQDEFYRKWCEDVRHGFDKYHIDPKSYLYWDGALTCIFDGMNGDYIFFGFVLSASKAESWEGLSNMSIPTVHLDKFRMSVERIIVDQGLPGIFGVQPDVQLHAFSHYS